MTLPVALLTCSLLVYQTHRLYKAIEQQKGPAFRCAERRRRLVSSGTSLPRNQVVYWLIDTRSTIQASKAEELQATTGANESKSFRVRHKCSGRKNKKNGRLPSRSTLTIFQNVLASRIPTNGPQDRSCARGFVTLTTTTSLQRYTSLQL